MQPKGAHFLRLGSVGGSAEERREVLDPLHVVMLGFWRELADRHVFDHAPTQRADGLIRADGSVAHGDAPVLSEVLNPSISRQDAPFRYGVGRAAGRSALPRERFSRVLDMFSSLEVKVLCPT